MTARYDCHDVHNPLFILRRGGERLDSRTLWITPSALGASFSKVWMHPPGKDPL